MEVQPALFETHAIRRIYKEGSELVSNCYQLKMPAADGKQRLTDVATAETLLRLVQSVPSPQWTATAWCLNDPVFMDK